MADCDISIITGKSVIDIIPATYLHLRSLRTTGRHGIQSDIAFCRDVCPVQIYRQVLTVRSGLITLQQDIITIQGAVATDL